MGSRLRSDYEEPYESRGSRTVLPILGTSCERFRGELSEAIS